jgi:hypothetical protein
MTQSPTDPVQVLAAVMTDATAAHPELHDQLSKHQNEVADAVMTAILAKTQEGADLRAALGVEVTQTTRMGKNLRAAMDAFTEGDKP